MQGHKHIIPGLRLARADDAAALAALKLATFRETFLDRFAIPYPPADLAAFEAEQYAVGKVAAELAASDHQSWVIERDGTLVGYAHAGPCKLPHPEALPGATELYQLYLRNEIQGGGLGSALLDHVLAVLEKQPGPIWLGVWSGNMRAQQLYARRGFVHVGDYRFRVGKWFDDEYIFRRD